MKAIELPVKYYLTHFFELLDTLEELYLPAMEASHKAFLSDFRALSEEAQCLYVRMVNRKGVIFSQNSFEKYSEISLPLIAIDELKNQKFISQIKTENTEDVLYFLTKPHLINWLKLCGIEAKASQSREDIIVQALERKNLIKIDLIPDYTELIVRARDVDLEYLLFLYFGKIQKSLNLYTLRDLGIRKANTAKQFSKPRYTSILDAKNQYFLSKSLETLEEIDSPEKIINLFKSCLFLQNLKSPARKLRNELFLNLADLSDDGDLTLQILTEVQAAPAREKRCRLLYKLERKEECRELLEQICHDPFSDEEILFAEDFLARKFEKKKTGCLTEVLNQAQEIQLSESYLKKPEQGMRDFYRAQGMQAEFTENHIWNALFGLLFWDELFEKENSALFNQFERSPVDLVDEGFYNNHQDSIEKKLVAFKNVKLVERQILKIVSLHHGKQNDIFNWSPDLILKVLSLINASTGKNLPHILRTMTRNFEVYHKGYPDLMVIENGVARFIEVKAEGDTLRLGQLSKSRLLKEAGYEVEVIKVKWQVDPNQIYVVVDLETTGGMAHSHRVTEIGAVKIRDGKIIEEFQTLINPDRPIPKGITHLTGISNEMVQNSPKFSEIAEKFDEFTRNAIFVAHNVRFDYGFIQREYERINLQYVRPQICTVQAMRKNFPGLQSYSLKNLTQHFRISLDTHHRALCDAKAAAELLLLVNGQKAAKDNHFIVDEYSTDFPKEA